MEIYYTHKAREDFEKISLVDQKRIAKKMRFYASVDDPLKFAKRLTNLEEGQFRFRVGDYRIFFDVIKGKIFVLKISRRDKAY